MRGSSRIGSVIDSDSRICRSHNGLALPLALVAKIGSPDALAVVRSRVAASLGFSSKVVGFALSALLAATAVRTC
jgi:hypothetical protein